MNASTQSPSGRYTCHSVAPAASTGATRRSRPSIHCSGCSHTSGSPGWSKYSGRMSGELVAIESPADETRYGTSRSRRSVNFLKTGMTRSSPVRSAMFHGVRSREGVRWWLNSEWYCMIGTKAAVAAERRYSSAPGISPEKPAKSQPQ